MLAVAEVKLRAIKEYKALVYFEAKVVEGLVVAYGYGFEACNAPVE